MSNVPVIRNVRIPLSLDTEIRRIAEFEDRTISKVIQRLLQRAVNKYLKDNEQSMLQDEEMRKQRFYDILEEADEIDESLTDDEQEAKQSGKIELS